MLGMSLKEVKMVQSWRERGDGSEGGVAGVGFDFVRVRVRIRIRYRGRVSKSESKSDSAFGYAHFHRLHTIPSFLEPFVCVPDAVDDWHVHVCGVGASSGIGCCSYRFRLGSWCASLALALVTVARRVSVPLGGKKKRFRKSKCPRVSRNHREPII